METIKQKGWEKNGTGNSFVVVFVWKHLVRLQNPEALVESLMFPCKIINYIYPQHTYPWEQNQDFPMLNLSAARRF